MQVANEGKYTIFLNVLLWSSINGFTLSYLFFCFGSISEVMITTGKIVLNQVLLWRESQIFMVLRKLSWSLSSKIELI